MDAALLFPVALALAGLCLWSVHTVGRWFSGILSLEVSDPGAAHLALGLTVYAVAGAALGAVGLYRWPVLAVAALAPGLAAVRRGCRSMTAGVSDLGSAVRESPRALVVVGGLLAALYLAVATAPTFHYDLLVNYLGVPKDYLLQGSLAALPHNIHSSLSLALHILIGYPLAVSELLNRTEFLFGAAPVWGALHLLVIVAVGRRLQLFAGVLTRRRETARDAGWMALLLWLAMPQTLLLALLENAEFLTTYLAIAAAGVALASRRRDDPLVAGLLCGLMVASKPQSAIFAACALAVTVRRTQPVSRILAAIGAAVLLPVVAMVRGASAFGSPFFPYRSGPGFAGDAARGLLAENAVSLPGSIDAFGSRIWELVTLQPETGITLLVVLAVFLGRLRSLPYWTLATVAVLIPVVTSSNTHNSLRWIQPGLVLLILASAINLAAVASRRHAVRWAAAVYLLASIGLAVSFVVRTTGPFPHLLMSEQAFLADRIPTYTVRRTLMKRPGRVLWMGELYGYYGATKGPIPAPQNGTWFRSFVGAGSADAIRDRLVNDGYVWMSLCRLHRATAPGTEHWDWMTEAEVNAMGQLIGSLPAEHPMDGVSVYRLSPPPRSAR